MNRVGTLGLVLRGVLAGAVFAILGTLFHQSTISGIPFGLAMTLVSVFAYSVSLRPSRSESWSFALSVSVMVFVFAQDFGADKLIPASMIGYIWSYGAIAITLLVAMFPRIR
jgi:uncharacterized membrane protein (UPF0136 family)